MGEFLNTLKEKLYPWLGWIIPSIVALAMFGILLKTGIFGEYHTMKTGIFGESRMYGTGANVVTAGLAGGATYAACNGVSERFPDVVKGWMPNSNQGFLADTTGDAPDAAQDQPGPNGGEKQPDADPSDKQTGDDEDGEDGPNWALWISLIVVVLAVVGGAVWWFVLRDPGSEEEGDQPDLENQL